MSIRDRRTMCGHESVETAGLRPDPGGQVHEVGSCTGCGTRLHRASPLDSWSPAEEED